MSNLIEEIALCVESGKVNAASPYPPNMKGQPGSDELTKQALEEGVSPDDILNKSLVVAMNKVGQQYSENKIFVPQMLLAAKAMAASMQHLKPFFQSGEVKRKGTFIMGTVFGDLHDIGKNLCCMMIEGAGWEVIDLGVDVQAEKFINELNKHPNAVVGLSALLTTTMVNMGVIISSIREKYPKAKVAVGGAPVNLDFAKQINADQYGKNPQELIGWLDKIAV
ncbi:MAG: cobalamin-dependent protein [Bacteroidales bacterium]|jgi:5-methyltetrahydrofolate--homocysteine methyltransferase|nr:cobalamin-dependent protein [Bacteroidales bacterium]